MQIVLELPDEVAAEAESRGVSVESYVKDLVDGARKSKPEGTGRLSEPGPYTPEEAGRNLRELSRRLTLGGVKIKDLIHEGHKY